MGQPRVGQAEVVGLAAGRHVAPQVGEAVGRHAEGWARAGLVEVAEDSDGHDPACLDVDPAGTRLGHAAAVAQPQQRVLLLLLLGLAGGGGRGVGRGPDAAVEGAEVLSVLAAVSALAPRGHKVVLCRGRVSRHRGDQAVRGGGASPLQHDDRVAAGALRDVARGHEVVTVGRLHGDGRLEEGDLALLPIGAGGILAAGVEGRCPGHVPAVWARFRLGRRLGRHGDGGGRGSRPRGSRAGRRGPAALGHGSRGHGQGGHCDK